MSFANNGCVSIDISIAFDKAFIDGVHDNLVTETCDILGKYGSFASSFG